jgi:hypothetical protein
LGFLIIVLLTRSKRVYLKAGVGQDAASSYLKVPQVRFGQFLSSFMDRFNEVSAGVDASLLVWGAAFVATLFFGVLIWDALRARAERSAQRQRHRRFVRNAGK